MDQWGEEATELLGSVAARTVTRNRTDIAQRKLLTLSRVMRRITHEGLLPSQINLPEIDVDPVGFNSGEFLKDALQSAEFDGAAHARVGNIISLCGVAHPNLRSSPRWEAWRHDHAAAVARVNEVMKRLHQSLQQLKAGGVAVEMADSWYRRLSSRWTELMLAAEQVVHDARTNARAALEEADLLRLAFERELGSARRLFGVGDV